MIDISVVSEESSHFHAPNPTVIKIIGCGGGGSSAVNRMIESGVSDVEFIVLNTDVQALNVSRAAKRLAIGQELTGGLGAGGNPDVGESAAKEDTELINSIVKGADMVIITAGMGGGTGTGSAPIVAQIAREQGALTIAVVTTPFAFEGPVRMRNAQEGLRKLKQNVDSLIIIPNQQVMKIVDKKMNYRQAFRLADDVLCQGVQGISEIITKPGEVNIDFADVKSVMKDRGEAILGVGIASGENRAVDAAQRAISNPMLENRHIDSASNILINITSAEDLSMSEIEEIIKNITASASPNHSLFWGQVLDPDMEDRIAVTVIATGFDSPSEYAPAETVKAKNPNVLDYGEFDDILSPRTKRANIFQESPESAADSNKVSTINLTLNAETFREDSVPASIITSKTQSAQSSDEEPSLTDSLRSALGNNSTRTPPADFNTNPNDLKQPAVWRNSLKNLSRGIDLSQE